MLKIHHSLLELLPNISNSSHVGQLSPVMSESDELIQAIEDERRKDSWENDSNDAESIEKFWSGVEEDIHNDPEWITFEDDDPEE